MNVDTKPSKAHLRGATGDWEVVIGLEVHAQVNSKAKLLLRGFHGIRRRAKLARLAGRCRDAGHASGDQRGVRAPSRAHRLGLKAKINLKSVFDRKNYFYPDLPQGYQISQYKSPIVGEGAVLVDMADGETVTVGIERLHLEQDAGKSLHDQHPSMSYVDLNRSGVALMEIVSMPDLRSADEAKAYVSKLRTILRYLGTCDGDMEKGNLRADVNVSVRRRARLRHPLRDQKRQLDPLHRPGDRARGAPPDRNHRGRRQDRAGRLASMIRSGTRRAPCVARRTHTTIATSRIPIFCRWN